jgi:hypothetical protein
MVFAKAPRMLVGDETINRARVLLIIFRKNPSEENESLRENEFWSALQSVARVFRPEK